MEQTEGAPTGPEMGAFARVVNVFFSPGKTFESIARKPTFVIPLVLVVLSAGLAGFAITSKLDTDAVVEQSIQQAEEQQGRELTEEERDRTEKVIRFMLPIQGGVIALFSVLAVLLVPSLYHLIAMASGKATRWAAVFSAYLHVQMIHVLKGLAFTGVAFGQSGEIDQQGLQQLLKSNVGAFLDPETTNRAALAFLSQVDIFEIWALIVGVIALTKVTRFKTGGAVAVVGGLWILWVVLTSLLAMLGG